LPLREALKPLGIEHAIDYDGKDGPKGHPGIRASGGTAAHSSGSGRAMRMPGCAYRLCRQSKAAVNAFYKAAMAAGATDNGKPSVREYYDPRYYAANVLDPDGYSLEAVYKSWQHRQS
jgi:hypothetical protein